MKHLGIDYGTRRIGIAISDAMGMIASPLKIIHEKNPEKALNLVIECIKENGAEKIVVGHARNMDGTAGFKAKECSAFAEKLVSEGFVVDLWDERLSSIQAERSLREANLTNKKRRERLDAVAAQLILQNYLDANHGSGL